MPIVDHKGNKQVHLGAGDILISPGLLKDNPVVGVICFTEHGTGNVGDRTDFEPNTILEPEDVPVRLTFDTVQSVDVLITMLWETKKLMLNKAIENLK